MDGPKNARRVKIQVRNRTYKVKEFGEGLSPTPAKTRARSGTSYLVWHIPSFNSEPTGTTEFYVSNSEFQIFVQHSVAGRGVDFFH